jgi:hypothetical protein
VTGTRTSVGATTVLSPIEGGRGVPDSSSAVEVTTDGTRTTDRGINILDSSAIGPFIQVRR